MRPREARQWRGPWENWPRPLRSARQAAWRQAARPPGSKGSSPDWAQGALAGVAGATGQAAEGLPGFLSLLAAALHPQAEQGLSRCWCVAGMACLSSSGDPGVCGAEAITRLTPGPPRLWKSRRPRPGPRPPLQGSLPIPGGHGEAREDGGTTEHSGWAVLGGTASGGRRDRAAPVQGGMDAPTQLTSVGLGVLRGQGLGSGWREHSPEPPARSPDAARALHTGPRASLPVAGVWRGGEGPVPTPARLGVLCPRLTRPHSFGKYVRVLRRVSAGRRGAGRGAGRRRAPPVEGHGPDQLALSSRRAGHAAASSPASGLQGSSEEDTHHLRKTIPARTA